MNDYELITEIAKGEEVIKKVCSDCQNHHNRCGGVDNKYNARYCIGFIDWDPGPTRGGK